MFGRRNLANVRAEFVEIWSGRGPALELSPVKILALGGIGVTSYGEDHIRVRRRLSLKEVDRRSQFGRRNLANLRAEFVEIWIGRGPAL